MATLREVSQDEKRHILLHTLLRIRKRGLLMTDIDTQIEEIKSITSGLMLDVKGVVNKYNNPEIAPKAMNDELDAAYHKSTQAIKTLLIQQQGGLDKPSDTAKPPHNQADKSCVFCEKIANESLVTYGKAVVFTPLNPVTEGHLLVVPTDHVSKLSHMTIEEKSHLFNALTFATSGLREYNLINSFGANATQTIEHLHFHVVPRRKDDGLHLPWTNQVKVTDLASTNSEPAKTHTKSAKGNSKELGANK